MLYIKDKYQTLIFENTNAKYDEIYNVYSDNFIHATDFTCEHKNKSLSDSLN